MAKKKHNNILTPEEEKMIAKISGEEIEKAVEILDSAEVNSTMIADKDGIHNLVDTSEDILEIVDLEGERIKTAVIENASETLGKPADQLGADMVRLNGINESRLGVMKELFVIDRKINEFLNKEKLADKLKKLEAKLSSTPSQTVA